MNFMKFKFILFIVIADKALSDAQIIATKKHTKFKKLTDNSYNVENRLKICKCENRYYKLE